MVFRVFVFTAIYMVFAHFGPFWVPFCRFLGPLSERFWPPFGVPFWGLKGPVLEVILEVPKVDSEHPYTTLKGFYISKKIT